MVSTCLMGQTGMAAPLAGYGTHAAAVSGFAKITGWPDRLPGGPYVAYTDTIAPRFLAATVMAALDHQRRTGEGQHVEQSQMESALYFLSPELLDYQVSGTIASRAGNVSPTDAPHGIYPCADASEERRRPGIDEGTDHRGVGGSVPGRASQTSNNQWCAIAVETDEQWRALRRALGEPAWAANPAYETAAGRTSARKAIDERLAEWTREREPAEVMAALQAAGVPAGAVQRSSDLLQDPQLRHRGFFHPMTHPEMGAVPYEGHQFNIRGYESGPRFPAPCLGEHTIEILRDVLGMSDEEIAEVAASDALV
jgi:benzylsuccinate CoA-transferase BbsF subunit